MYCLCMKVIFMLNSCLHANSNSFFFINSYHLHYLFKKNGVEYNLMSNNGSDYIFAFLGFNNQSTSTSVLFIIYKQINFTARISK